MYYTYNWFWSVLWVVPLLFLLWGMFGWNGRRTMRSRGGRYYRLDEDYDIDEPWWTTRREGLRRLHRGRGPRNYRRADDRILEDVSDRLLMADDVDASDIEVHVEQGTVALTGAVATRYEKRRAENLADWVAGVVDVDNQLRIGSAANASKTAPPANDETIVKHPN